MEKTPKSKQQRFLASPLQNISATAPQFNAFRALEIKMGRELTMSELAQMTDIQLSGYINYPQIKQIESFLEEYGLRLGMFDADFVPFLAEEKDIPDFE